MKSKDAAHRTCDMDTLEVIEQNENRNENENEIGRAARISP